MAMKKICPRWRSWHRRQVFRPPRCPRVLNHKGIVKADTYNRVVAVLQAKGYPFVGKAAVQTPLTF